MRELVTAQVEDSDSAAFVTMLGWKLNEHFPAYQKDAKIFIHLKLLDQFDWINH